MIEKTDVISFFDSLAPGWDAEMIRDDDVIDEILDNAGVVPGSRVLDVACGTGVLIPDYLSRKVASVTAVDISPEMARLAADKFAGQPSVKVICCDAETADMGGVFDNIVIYNAFPHFSDPSSLFRNLCRHLAPGGTLTVAHGKSRDWINNHHRRCSSTVSRSLMSADELVSIMGEFLTIYKTISNDRMYQVCGEMTR